ncbi:venom dipeptidyl peptidase 4-like [Anoplophora glabripennis]|nr:venom dipeptidyl peptidase 4-like [Anoplophora glabripennis]
MGLPTPEDNEIGYNNTDVTREAEAFRGRRYFIIHGNADDNVHYQNAMALVKALEHADVDFRQQSYPDENHSLTYVSRHLYHTIDKFFARCFDIEDPPFTVWHKKESF